MIYRRQLSFWSLILIGFALALSYLPLQILGLVIGATISLILLIRWPWLIWIGIAALLPMSSGFKIGPLSLTDGLLFMAIGLWFADGIRRRTLYLRIDRQITSLLFALLFYIGILILSLFNATDLGEAVAEVIKWVEFTIVLILAPQMIPPEKRYWLVAALLLGAVGQSLLGLYQFINRIGPPWFMILGRFMRASGSFSQPNPYAGYLGLTLPVAVSLLFWAWSEILNKKETKNLLGRGPDTDRDGNYKPTPSWKIQMQDSSPQKMKNDPQVTQITDSSNLRNLRNLWINRQMARPNCFHFSVNPLVGRKGMMISCPYWIFIVSVAVSLLIAAAMVASWSRGAWLGALIGVGAVFILSSRRVALMSIIALLILGSVFMVGGLSLESASTVIPAPIMDRVQDLPAYFGLTDVLNQPLTDENFAVVERMAHWVAAIRMWEQAPWLGVGPGNYAAIYPAVRLPFWEEPLGHAHNIYLNVLGETGIIGLMAYLILWGTVVFWSIRIWRTDPSTWNTALALGVLGVLLHLTVHNFFDNLFVQGMYLHVGLWLALLSTSHNPQRI